MANKIKLKKFCEKNGYYFFLLWIVTIILIYGMTFNFYAVQSNGGRMPVESYLGGYLDTDKHFSFEDRREINNYYLTDIINLKMGIYSLGDIIMVLSVLGMIGIVGDMLINSRKLRHRIFI